MIEPQPSARPGILTEVGLSYCAGRTDIYARMLARFRETKGAIPDELRQALAQGDPETAARIAHTMKSTALAIGAVELSEAARALEESLVSGGTGELEARLDRFQGCLDEVLEGLRS